MRERGLAPSGLARKCLEEVIGRGSSGKVGAGWEKERREFFEHRGWNLEERDEEGSPQIGGILLHIHTSDDALSLATEGFSAHEVSTSDCNLGPELDDLWSKIEI